MAEELKKTIMSGVVKAMKQLGNYRKEYDPIIDIYAGMREQYELLTQKAEETGEGWYATRTADGGQKKSPLSLTLENLRKDILQYSDRLMLNPKSRSDAAVQKEERKSKLAEALKGGP